MTRHQNAEIIQEVFSTLQHEFGNIAPRIIHVLAGCMGGVRLTFPDLQELYRQERNRRIRAEFNGVNYEELAIKYRLRIRHIRRIIGAA